MQIDIDEELEFLRWFYDNCDFGPADAEVRKILLDEYKQTTGRTSPYDWRIRNAN